MNRLNKTVWTLGILVIFLIVGFSPANAQGRSVSLQTFYDELSYHGDWINNPDYGYVWRPNVGNDFRPYYTNGRWLMTEYGNTWVSDYSWGWAPFHYGRWFYDDYDGWIWLPDTEWGPAWVDWRTGGGYYGWAPMGPRITVNINIGRRYYPDNYWVFIPQRHIYYTGGYYNYWQPNRNVVIIKNTTIINNVYVDRSNRNVRYNSGPRADDIRRATRQSVTVHKIADANRPGSSRVDRGTVNIYRPQVDRAKDATPRAIANNNTTRPSRSEAAAGNSGRGNTVSTRDNNAGSTSRPSRNTADDSRTREVNNTRATVPSRTAEPTTGRSSSESRRPSTTTERSQAAPQRERGTTIERSTGSTPSESRRPERTERSQPAERSSSTPQRVERSSPSGNADRQSAPQRVERSSPSGSSERQSAPQRTERSSAPQRVERPAPSSPSPSRSTERSSGGGSSSRSSGGSSRPGR
jgi:hypothetical protein